MRKFIFAFLCILLYSDLISHSQVLRVAFVGDPQVDNIAELHYARRSVYKSLAAQKNLDFAIILGDLVNDAPELLLSSKAILDSLPFPCFIVPGNHDFDDYGAHARSRDLKTFNDVIGPSDTTFVVDRYRFVLMNNVRITDIRNYEGGFTEKQKSWLDSLVRESSEKDNKLVLCTHIPLSYSKGLDSLSSILSSKANYLLVSGHTHAVRRHSWKTADGRAIPELIAGASCGSWWRGVKGEDGVPYALQNCGSPRGYFIAEMSNDDIRLSYIRTDNQKRRKKVNVKNDKNCLSAFNLKDSLLVINIFGGAEDGDVIVKYRHRKFKLKRTDMTAVEVENEILRNQMATRKERKERKSDFIPLRRKKSPHIWSTHCHIPNGKKITVIYHDDMMNFRCKTIIQNSDALLYHPWLEL